MNALEPSRRAPSRPGPDDEAALGAQLVGQPVDERLLGADHVEVRLDARRGQVGHRDRRALPSRRCPG